MKQWLATVFLVTFSLLVKAQDTLVTYTADGRLAERKMMSRYEPEKLQWMEQYEEGKLHSVTYYDFTVAEDPQESYEGIYKNGGPFSGYFKLYTLIDDIPLIDYYENAHLKYRYSFELLEQLEGYMHYIYDQQTVYEHGRILNGPDYKTVGKERLLTFHYQDGKVHTFDVNLFAMHYFNRMIFKREEKGLFISEMESPMKLYFYGQEDKLKVDIHEEDQTLASIWLSDFLNGETPMENLYQHFDNKSELMLRIVLLSSFSNVSDTNQLFEYWMANFQKENLEDALSQEPQ